jgi:hypothetical protein
VVAGFSSVHSSRGAAAAALVALFVCLLLHAFPQQLLAAESQKIDVHVSPGFFYEFFHRLCLPSAMQ